MTTLRYGGEHEHVTDGRQAHFDQQFNDVIRAERWPVWAKEIVSTVMDAWEGREWALLHPDEAEEDGSVGRY